MHEWAKHGTCVSTLEPRCYGDDYIETEEVVDYFAKAVEIFHMLPTFKVPLPFHQSSLADLCSGSKLLA
jgi:ribonuclease I